MKVTILLIGKKDKCVICKFLLKTQPTNFKAPDDEIFFGHFVIRYEHKFLRNIYIEKQIKDSEHVKDLESYYDIFNHYIEICIGMLALLNSVNRYSFINYAIEEFVEDNFAGEEISEIKITIIKT